MIDLDDLRGASFSSFSLFLLFLFLFGFRLGARSSNRFDANEINGRGGGEAEGNKTKALYEGSVIKGFRNILADKQTL